MRMTVLALGFTLLLSSQTGSIPRPQSMADWQRMIPAVREALKAQFPDQRIEGPYPVEILRVADITADGVPEALVFFGVGGAFTSQLTLIRVEGGKPVVALFKDRAGLHVVLTGRRTETERTRRECR